MGMARDRITVTFTRSLPPRQYHRVLIEIARTLRRVGVSRVARIYQDGDDAAVIVSQSRARD
jgi:hypothetical protein